MPRRSHGPTFAMGREIDCSLHHHPENMRTIHDSMIYWAGQRVPKKYRHVQQIEAYFFTTRWQYQSITNHSISSTETYF